MYRFVLLLTIKKNSELTELCEFNLNLESLNFCLFFFRFFAVSMTSAIFSDASCQAKCGLNQKIDRGLGILNYKRDTTYYIQILLHHIPEMGPRKIYLFLCLQH